MRVMRTADDPPKCKGLALIRYLDRDVAKKAVEEMSSKKVHVLRVTSSTRVVLRVIGRMTSREGSLCSGICVSCTVHV